MIGPQKASIGDRIHAVQVQQPGPTVPDGDGGFVTGPPVPGEPPLWYVAVRRASQTDLERLTAGTVIATATHIVIGPYRPDITLASRLLLQNRRVLQVTGLASIEERDQELICICVEQITATPYPQPTEGAAA